MKFSDILKTANSNLRRSKARTALTIIAIFIGAFTLTLTNGIGAGINKYIDKQLGNLGAEDMLIIQAKSDDNPLANGPKKYEQDKATTNIAGFPMTVLNENDVTKIKQQPGIVSAELEKSATLTYMSGPNGEKFVVSGSQFYDGLNVTLTDGQSPNNHTDEYQVVLTPGDQTYLGFASAADAIGKTVQVAVTASATNQNHEVTATVIGVQAEGLSSAGGVLLNQPLNKKLFALQTEGLPESVVNQQPMAVARFDLKSGQTIDQIKQGLSDKGYDAKTIQDQIGLFKQVIGAIVMVLNFFAGIALLAASFGIVNTLLMAVQERTKEIGLMKAMGMGRRKIFTLFASEAILIGFWGSLLGVLAGVGAGHVINIVARETFLKDLIGFNLTAFPPMNLAFVVLLVMAIAFLAGTLPARRASKKDPIEALRTE